MVVNFPGDWRNIMNTENRWRSPSPKLRLVGSPEDEERYRLQEIRQDYVEHAQEGEARVIGGLTVALASIAFGVRHDGKGGKILGFIGGVIGGITILAGLDDTTINRSGERSVLKKMKRLEQEQLQNRKIF